VRVCGQQERGRTKAGTTISVLVIRIRGLTDVGCMGCRCAHGGGCGSCLSRLDGNVALEYVGLTWLATCCATRSLESKQNRKKERIESTVNSVFLTISLMENTLPIRNVNRKERSDPLLEMGMDEFRCHFLRSRTFYLVAGNRGKALKETIHSRSGSTAVQYSK
jgi:hypothetical protein